MNNIIVFRRSGGFYICFDNDAIIMNYLCNYKISNGKVGFPVNTINKVINILDSNSINYVIKDNTEDKEKKIFGKKNKYKYYLEKEIDKIDIDKRMNRIMNKINNLSMNKLNSLLDIIEIYINE